MSEKISMVRRLRLEANGLGEFQTYASRDYRRMLLDAAEEIERLRKERDEARRELERLYDEKFKGNGALDLLADLDEECGL